MEMEITQTRIRCSGYSGDRVARHCGQTNTRYTNERTRSGGGFLGLLIWVSQTTNYQVVFQACKLKDAIWNKREDRSCLEDCHAIRW